MKLINKQQLMVWTIVVLSVLNITTIITVVLTRNRNTLTVDAGAKDPIQSENASMRFSGRFFHDQLGLDNDQLAKFREFNPEFRRNAGKINSDLNKIRLKMLDEMSSGKCDSIRLNNLSDSIGYLHADLKKLTYRYYIDFKNICNKEQKEKLDKLFGEMFASDVRTRQNGPGGPNGRGRGRQFYY